MNAKGITYLPSDTHDVLTLMSQKGVAYATKRIPKDDPTPNYPGSQVFRDTLEESE